MRTCRSQTLFGVAFVRSRGLVRMETPPQQHIRHAFDRQTFFEGAKKQIPIFRPTPFVPSPEHAAQDGGPKHDRRVQDRAFDESITSDLVTAQKRILPCEVAAHAVAHVA